MKRLIIFIYCTLCLPNVAIAGVSNIKHMSRNSNDSFDVICLNRTLETVNSTAILDNSVCSKTVTDKPPSETKGLICTGNTPWSRITRISDGTNIGGDSSLEQCQEALRASTNGLICTGKTPWSTITRISDGTNIGDDSSFEQCQKALRASTNGLICTGKTPWSTITRISDGRKIGSDSSFEQCQKALRALNDNSPDTFSGRGGNQ
jgi:hypothetical protein